MIANLDGGAARRSAPAAGRALNAESLDRALEATRSWLLDNQHADGYWVGELEGDTILESEYVLLMAFLGRGDDPVCVRAAKYLHDHARPEGGWAIYPGGPFDLSASVEAYFALKVVGMDPDHPTMVAAREAILDGGGARRCNSFTRFYLALLGQISYDDCPSVPPEIALLPRRIGFGLYDMSAWTRAMVVTLSIVSALKPVRALPAGRGIGELFRDDVPALSLRGARLLSWENFFLGVDRAIKFAEKVLPASARRPGLRAAHRWILDHYEDADGLGAIFPPMVYSIFAMTALGYDPDSAPMRWALDQLEALLIEEDGAVRVQPCVSPTWDTAISTIALAETGLPSFHPALLRSVRWLLAKEVRTEGDWHARRPGVEPSGWHFQFRNRHYPDIDDTAMVLLALRRTCLADNPEVRAATARGVEWILSLQNRDGGWAAYDVDVDNQILTKVPFADHNAMLDPSCADITARVIELLGELGYRAGHPSIDRALDYLWASQEEEGCWYGRWGVNYIYGTWQVLLGLQAIEHPLDDPRVRRAADWLESVQQAGGGWGESCASYEDPSLKGRGEVTASQTAWGVLGLIAAGRARGAAARRGVQQLLATQKPDGTWDEDQFTGTGFPKVFYLKYHLYRINFPLFALARFKAAAGLPAASTSPGALASRVPAQPRSMDV